MNKNLEKLSNMAKGKEMINMSTDLNPIKKEKKEAIRTQEIEDALDFLCSYEDYSPYQKNINLIYDYIINLEQRIKN